VLTTNGLAGKKTAVDSQVQSRIRERAGRYAFLYLLFVIYGSLVPLEFKDRPLDEALGAFSPPHWLHLDSVDRADWIANLLLYVPLAFLTLAASSGDRSKPFLRTTAILLSLGLLAVAIEFLQLFFPPRTVSLNDLVAESVGIALGGLAWVLAGDRFLLLAGAALRDPYNARRAIAAAFVLGYVIFAFFPFDVVVSAAELKSRFGSDLVGLWTAPGSCSGTAICFARALLDAAIGAMLGVALHWLRRHGANSSAMQSALVGLFLGVGVELLQVFFFSGVAQGVSAVARALGIALGFRFAAQLPWAIASALRWRGLTWWIAVGSILYVAAVLLVNGWFTTRFGTVAEALRRSEELRLLPFYYYYYVTEQWAVKSAAAQLVMYAPVGLLVALAGSARQTTRASLGWVAAILGAAFALVIEVGKPFLGKRPDPTDILFALCASYAAYWLVVRVVQSLGSSSEAVPAPTAIPTKPSRFSVFGPVPVLGAILLLAVGFGVLRYPTGAIWLALGLCIYAVALIPNPSLWLFALPALLPILDRGQWTGWLFADEFDLLILTTIGALCLVPRQDRPEHLPVSLRVLFVIWAVAAAVAFLRGFLPMEALSPDSFWGVHANTNALRIGRAILWLLLIVMLHSRWGRGRDHDIGHFAKGMAVGLIGTGLMVLWERTTFAGFLNFEPDYRAVGALSAASTAGAQIESFVAAATPFSMLLMVRSRNLRWRALGFLGLVLATYAVAATVSRTALLGVATSAAIFLLWPTRTTSNGAGRRSFLPVAFIVVALIISGTLIATTTSVLSRFSQAADDFEARRHHWISVLHIMGVDWSNQLLGVGLGTFPATFYWNAFPSERPSLFSFKRDGKQSYVRFGTGGGVYLDQIVHVEQGQHYTVRARIRSPIAMTTLAVALCEKWILYSKRCQHRTLQIVQQGQWRTVAAEFDSFQFGGGAWPFRPTVKLSLKSAQFPLDITDVQLVDSANHNQVRNGRFALSGTHWLVSADNHWPWNIFNLFLEVFFEQGWFGLLSFVLLLGYSMTSLSLQAWRGDRTAAAYVASICGFLIPSIFDSVIDEPRMRLLLMLLVTLPMLEVARQTVRESAAGGGSADQGVP